MKTPLLKVDLVADTPPRRPSLSPTRAAILALEGAAGWCLLTGRTGRTATTLGGIVLGLVGLGVLIGPWAMRRAGALDNARWRALRRIRGIDAAQLADRAPAAAAERLAYTQGVHDAVALAERVIREERERAVQDLGDTSG